MKFIISILFLHMYVLTQDIELGSKIVKKIIDVENIVGTQVKKSDLVINEFKKPYILISLGDSCRTAMHIICFRLSECSFPLNWVITPFSGLMKLFKNDFKGFLNKENLENRSPNGVYEKEYSVLTVHHFPHENIMSVCDVIKERFERRILRLYRALKSNKLVYFIRTEITKSETIQFIKLLDIKFPNLNYVFVAIGGTQEFEQPWNIPKVRNFLLRDYYVKEKIYYDPENWKPIFEELNLIDKNFTDVISYSNLFNYMS